VKLLIDDGMQVSVGTGIGKYTLYLHNTVKQILNEQGHVDLLQFDKGTSGKKGGRLKYLMHINSKAYLKKCEKYDVVHYTNYAMPFRRSKKIKYVVTIHDLSSFLYPETLPFVYRLYSQAVIHYAIRYADVVLTDSYAAQKEIAEKWPNYACKVKVAYPGIYDEFNPEPETANIGYKLEVLKQLVTKRFFLFTGTIETRKNLSIVIKAFLALKGSGKADDYKLVLAGRAGYGYDQYLDLVKDSDYKSDIIFTGYIDSVDCKKLYQDAAAYIFPSVYEGFGSTQLECMINHLPLILSKIPTNLEISRDYGLFFDLEDQKSLEEQMCLIINDQYDEKQKNAVADQICGAFTWDNLIGNYLEAYSS